MSDTATDDDLLPPSVDPNKKALGYAVLDDLIGPYIRKVWVDPLDNVDDPISMLQRMVGESHKELDLDVHRLGCPLNNFAQEMSPLDEGFRVRIQRLFEMWKGGFVAAFRRGQAAGTVRPDIDPVVAGGFLLAVIEGVSSLAKAAQQESALSEYGQGVHYYLESLRNHKKH